MLDLELDRDGVADVGTIAMCLSPIKLIVRDRRVEKERHRPHGLVE
jgi:hypothetical protein